MLLLLQVTRPKAADEESFLKGTEHTAIVAVDPPAVGPLAEYYSNCCAVNTTVTTRILVGDFFVQSSDMFEAHCGRAGCTNSVMQRCMVLAGCPAGLLCGEVTQPSCRVWSCLHLSGPDTIDIRTCLVSYSRHVLL